ncbi:MAG: glucose-6-phosphate isomerase [Bacilli bacterium]
MLNLTLTNAKLKKPLSDYQERINRITDLIATKKGPGGDFLGWDQWPVQYDQNEFALIQTTAAKIREHFEVFVVCGIGGSYLGARAVIEAIRGLLPSTKKEIEIIYLGQTFSPTYTQQVLNYLEHKKFAINVISKSGTTTETSIAFRLLKALLEKKVGVKEARKAIFATTDKEKGALRSLANQEGYVTFNLPDDIGGRYSVLTAVGLLPIAVAGIDIQALMAGAKEAMTLYTSSQIETNLAVQYAIARHQLYEEKSVEMFVTYEPQFAMIAEWLKQLFAESEGKENKGLLPGSVSFSTDLHSVGQFIQDGSPILFETVLYVKKPALDVSVPLNVQDADGLNYLAGRPLSFVNEKAYLGTLQAHVEEGQVPVILLTLDQMDAHHLGHLLYFFMKACAYSGYLLGINPFNQPGVEIYKRNMFRLLGKKGY